MQMIRGMSDASPAARRIALPVGLVLTLLAVWEYWVKHFHVSPAVLAAPSAIVNVYALHFALMSEHFVPTTLEAVTGFALAAAAGIGLGTLLSFSSTLRRALYPHVIAFQLIPKIAVAPLFTLWFGIGSPGRLIFIVFMAFFPILVATMTGLLSTPPSAIKLCASLRATQWQIFRLVRFPFALPHVFAGLKIGATMAILGAIVAEFVTAQRGLGYLIMYGAAAGESAVVFAVIGLLCVIGTSLFAAVAIVQRSMQTWLGMEPGRGMP